MAVYRAVIPAGQDNVLPHLSSQAHLYADIALDAGRHLLKRFSGKGPHGDGPQQSQFHPLFSGLPHGGAAHAGGNAVGHQNQLGVLHHELLPALLILKHGLELLAHLGVVGFIALIPADVIGVVLLHAPWLAGQRPIELVDIVFLCLRHVALLDHLADSAVAENLHNVAILFRQIEGQIGQVGTFLHGGGSQHQQPLIAVAAASGRNPVAVLTSGDLAVAQTITHGVHQNGRQIGGGEIGDLLLLQVKARTGGTGHAASTAGGRTVQHTHTGNLVFALDEYAAALLHVVSHILQNLALGSDGIASIEAASRTKGSLSNGLVALYQHIIFTHVCFLLLLNGKHIVWAHLIAHAAANAQILVHTNNFIALLVDGCQRNNRFSGANAHTQSAPLAELCVCFCFCHILLLHLNRIFLKFVIRILKRQLQNATFSSLCQYFAFNFYIVHINFIFFCAYFLF